MKKLAVISIILLTLSGTVFASLSQQQEVVQQSEESFVSFLKSAFQFGYQTGWDKK